MLALMLVAAALPLAIGQVIDGVSLRLHGVAIPNNSLVDIDDLLYRLPFDPNPMNANGLHDRTLVCQTDLEDCCTAPHTVCGNWYYPDGSIVLRDARSFASFQRNRGPNEVIKGQQFYGSVRLWRRWSRPSGRGRFRCELPSAADPNVNQILYANIVDFGTGWRNDPVILSPSGPAIAGNNFSLTCSATLIDPIPLPSNVPCPTIEWLFGPNGDTSLPSGVTPTASIDNYTFISTLQFSPALNQSHAGMYACRLGPGRLTSSRVFALNYVQITLSGPPVLGQNNYTLTCRVLVADYLCPYITYQWRKSSNKAAIQFQIVYNLKSNALIFSSLRLSDAGNYTCNTTISSPHLDSNFSMMESHDIRIQIPAPFSVILSSSIPSPVRPIGSTITLTCTVYVNVDSSQFMDVPVTVTTVWTGPAGFRTTNASQPIVGGTTIYTSTAVVSSFGRNQSGVYTCTATLHSTLTNAYIINSSATADSIRVTTGVYLSLRNQFIANSSQISIKNVGQYSDSSSSALLCVTDKDPCCSNQNSDGDGEWYLPNGTLVQGNTSFGTVFHTSRGDNGEVFLNRPSNATSPTGQFCCKVPDATDTIQTLCVIIDRVTIIQIGSPIAGENYTLECSAGGSMATFEWLGPPDGRTLIFNSTRSSIVISSKSSSSQLQFRPLQQSHNGSYSCRAITDEGTQSSEPVEISVNVPKIIIQISDSTSGTVPTAGEDYALILNVLGAKDLNPTITYRWTKNSEMSQIGTNSNTLSFAPVRLSNAGNYSCLITIASNYLMENFAIMISHRVRVQIPAPSHITLMSDEANAIQIIGSNVTLTCTVELNPAILEPEYTLLTVDAQLVRDGAPLALADPTVTGRIFTYTVQLSKIGLSDFGNYTCTAIIRPQSSLSYLTGIDILSDTLTIKAVLPPPVGIRATQSSSSAPVEVSWSPPSDYRPFNITGYTIFYSSAENNISLPSVATNIGLRINENYSGQIVFLRSESDQLYSELVSVTVENIGLCSVCNMMCPCRCSREIGATVGVMVSLAITIVLILLLFWWRKKKITVKNIAVSANMAYKDVGLKPNMTEGEYENDDVIFTPPDQFIVSGQRTDNETIADSGTYESIFSSQGSN